MTTNEPKAAVGTWSWGTGAFGGDAVFGNALPRDTMRQTFDEAVANGLTLWDTAFVYAMGGSEKLVGEFAAAHPRESLLLSTKFTPQCAEMFGNSVEAMCDNSLKLLGTDYIDVYWIHNPADVERWTPGLVPLLKSGKVRSVGVSNHNLAEIRRANEILGAEGFAVSAVQNHFSLLYRSSERGGVLDYCKEHGIRFWAYMVLEQGALSGKYDTRHPLPPESDRGKTYNPILPQLERLVQVLRDVGAAHVGATPAQIAQAWAVSKGTLPIVGLTKPAYVADTLHAVSIALSEDEMARIDEASAVAGVDTRGSWEHAME